MCTVGGEVISHTGLADQSKLVVWFVRKNTPPNLPAKWVDALDYSAAKTRAYTILTND